MFNTPPMQDRLIRKNKYLTFRNIKFISCSIFMVMFCRDIDGNYIDCEEMYVI